MKTKFKQDQDYIRGFEAGRETAYKEIADCFDIEGGKRISGKRVAFIIRSSSVLQKELAPHA